MRYYKNLSGGCYESLSTGSGQVEITKQEYEETLAVVRACPSAPDGYGYRLTAERTWELYRLPDAPEDASAALTEPEALAGGDSGG